MNARHAVCLAAGPLAAAGFASSIAFASHTAATKPATVKAAYNKTLKKTVLVTASGRTLYRNTTERKGRVRCGQGCVSAWPPLVIPKGTRPTAGKGVAPAK